MGVGEWRGVEWGWGRWAWVGGGGGGVYEACVLRVKSWQERIPVLRADRARGGVSWGTGRTHRWRLLHADAAVPCRISDTRPGILCNRDLKACGICVLDAEPLVCVILAVVRAAQYA